MFGIENLKKCFNVLIEGGNVVGKAWEDGTINVADAGHLILLLDELTELGNVNFKAIPQEAKDLDAAEIAELTEHLKTKFDIPQDALEQKIEEGIALLSRLVKDGIDVYAYVKSFTDKEANEFLCYSRTHG